MLFYGSSFHSLPFSTHHHIILNEQNPWFEFPELHVKTVKYFKSIERVQDEVELRQAELKARGRTEHQGQVGSME